ncbi:MAG: hypothetical protein ACRC33_11915, partial [Gemmataceae bacterium]
MAYSDFTIARLEDRLGLSVVQADILDPAERGRIAGCPPRSCTHAGSPRIRRQPAMREFTFSDEVLAE